MRMVASVLGSGFVREHLVERHVVLAHAVHAVGHANNERAAQVAEQRAYGDIDDIVAEAPAIGPAARNEAAIAKGVLDFALEHVASEDAQTGEAGVVRIGGVGGAAA